MLIPRAKKENYSGKRFYICNTIKVLASDGLSCRIFEAMRIFFASSEIQIDKTDSINNADVILRQDKNLTKLEEYTLSAEDDRIEIAYSEFMGGRNAVVSLLQLVRFEDDNLNIIEAEINDWADNRMRGMLVDSVYVFIPVQKLKDTMLRMALSKMNLIHLHIVDNRGYRLESKQFPQLNPPGTGFYSLEEMKDIIEFGLSIGIDCLPELELTTHSQFLTSVFPGLHCKVDTAEPNGWAMCVGSPSFYEIITVLINEMAEVFPYPVLHIGTDEIIMYDLPKIWPDWYDCKHCRALAESIGIKLSTAEEVEERKRNGTFLEKGIDGINELFIYTIHKIYDIVKKAGKRVMMWNDNINIGKPTDLPRDILIHFWRIAAPYRGPREGCSMEAFLEAGFEVYNSHYPQTYIELDEYVPEIPLNTWSPHVYPECKEELKHKILGGGPCAWGTGNDTHFDFSLPSSLAFYSDRLWDETPGVYEKEFSEAITRLILGARTPEGFDVFPAVGGFFLPRDTEITKKPEEYRKAHVERITISPEDMINTSEYLNSVASERTFTGRIAEIYAECIDWAYERLPEKTEA